MTRVFLLAIVTACGMVAQTHGYVFVAPGVANYGNNIETPGVKGTTGFIHLGLGGEYLFKNTLGAGAEVGFLERTDLGSLGAASINGYYHFKRNGSWAPFATAGYSNFFELFQSTSLANIGGGVNYWYKDHMGIKLEVRDHFSSGANSANYLEFRFGFDFK